MASDATLARAQGLGFALGSLFLSQSGRSARSFGMEDGKIEKVLPFFWCDCKYIIVNLEMT